ncbi:MAG: acyl-[acyl-carrier-protein] thioesterase [Bdellovibrionaceae bacterium]|nr:acyl-[acyl-carrier-protein] thioesterase [Pseudobdellovibrionaceae bacterium]|tara:strand:+ start:84950 stop:85696 length:747 start_codon:yes stop_codon:yes gene_type:complete
MIPSIFEKDYEVNSVNINMNKRLGLYGMLGILQDVGTIHADLTGVGYEDMVKNNAFWVFTQQKLKMNQWPKWQDTINVKTWPRKVKGLKAYRDYTIHLGDQLIGESVATFMVLDGTSRRPVAPQLEEKFLQSIPEKELDILPEKIKVPDNMKVEHTLVVRNSDLDMNNHVNNTKYSQWILDTIPIKYHKNFVVREFDINFVSETHLGDEIDVYMIKEEDSSIIKSFYQGVRRSDGKVVFSSHITGVEI